MIGTRMFIALQMMLFAMATSTIMAQPGPSDPRMGPMAGPRGTMMPMPGTYRGPSSMGPSSMRSNSPSQPSNDRIRFGSVPPGAGRGAPTGYSGPGPYDFPGASGPGNAQSPRPDNLAPPDTSKIQRALTQKNYSEIGQETQGVRNRAEDIQHMGAGLPVEDRLKLPLLNHMYKRGADTIDEGSNSRDEYKVRMGVQQINEANEKYGRLENEIKQSQGFQPAQSQGPQGSPSDRSGRNNNSSPRSR